MRLLQLDELKRYVIFIAGGGVGAVVNWGISFVLTSLFGVYYLLSFTVAQLANIVVNFTWHRLVTFRVSTRSLTRFARFLTLSIATVILSLVLVYVLKEYIMDPLGEIILFGYGLNYLASIVAVTFVVSIINYLVSRAWVFNSAQRSHSVVGSEEDVVPCRRESF